MWGRRTLWVALPILLGFIALPHVVTVKYYLHLSILALVWVITAQGQNLIQGYTGYVSINQAGFMGIGAYSSALLSLHWGAPVWLSILAAPAVTALFALAAGYPSLRVKGHYFAIVTLAFNMVIFIVLLNMSGLTNGEAGLSGIPKPDGAGVVNFANRVVYYYFVLGVVVLIMVCTAVIVHSRIGQILKAIRQNEPLVNAVGIAAWKYKLFAFVSSGTFAGLGGALYAHYQNFINPDVFGVAQSLNAILAVIIGGSGTLFGPVIGAFTVVFLPEYLRAADAYRLIVYGFILIIATIFMPRGILGLASDAKNRLLRLAQR